MSVAKSLREYLSSKDEELQNQINVDMLLSSNYIKEIFTDEEVSGISSQENGMRTKIFIQKLYVKGDDRYLYKFIDVLRQLQPDITILSDIDSTMSSTFDTEVPSGFTCSTCTPVDIPASCSMNAPVLSLSDNLNKNSEPSKMSLYKEKVMLEDGNIAMRDHEKGGEYQDDNPWKVIIDQIYTGLHQINDLQEDRKDEIQHRFNNLVNECKATKDELKSYKSWFTKLYESILTMCNDGLVSDTNMVDFLTTMGQHELAQKVQTALELTCKEMHYSDLPMSVKLSLTQHLSGEANIWPLLPEWLNVEGIIVSYLREQHDNPAAAILDQWAWSKAATVQTLYVTLCNHKVERIAQMLEQYRYIRRRTTYADSLTI